MRSVRHRVAVVLALSLAPVVATRGVAPAFDVVLNAQNEFLDAYLMDGSSQLRRVFIDPDPSLFVRNIVPSGVPRNPLGIDVGSDGTVYYAELNLDPVTLEVDWHHLPPSPQLDPSRCGGE